MQYFLEIQKANDPYHFERVDAPLFESVDAAKTWARLHLQYEDRVVRVQRA
jgi:hypothetical protein